MRLDGLPNDVQISIFSYLQPLDILRVRKTCKALHNVTLHRIVWIEALRRVCKRNCIFMPTFPVEHMSLLHLEHAATGPERWLFNMTNTSSQGEKTLSCTAGPIKLGEEAYSPTSIHEMYLIPGGRYLITTGVDLLEVWDLGVPWSPSGIPSKARKISEADILTKAISVHGTPDGNGLLISFCSERAKITLYLIYPADEEPKLVKYAELPESIESTDFSTLYWATVDSRLVFLLGPTLNVWDYEVNAWASIMVEKDYQEIMVTKSAIAVIYPRHILIWAMPTLSNTRQFSPLLNATSIPPVVSVSIPVDISRVAFNFTVSSFWYCGSTLPLVFDVVYDGDLMSRRYKIVIGEDIRDATITLLGEVPDLADRVYQDSKFCDDALVTWWTIGNNVETQAVNISEGCTDSQGPGNSVLLYPVFQDDEQDIVPDFCPCSGRLVYMDLDKKINIVHFHLGIT